MRRALRSSADSRSHPNGEAAVSVEEMAKHPFLHGMPRAHLELLAQNAMRTHFEAGQMIFHEGELANRFYLIESGSVALQADAGGGNVALIQTVRSGDVLGWSWLFPPYYWHFSARALERTSAVFLYGTRLRNQCEDDHEFGYELIKRMAAVTVRRMQAARERLIEHYRQEETAL